jgi:uroporphyrinogen-III decarboxylase
MVLMGGVNTLSFVRCSPEEIHAEAMRCIQQGEVKGACFILGSGCALPRNARAENLQALANAAESMRNNENSSVETGTAVKRPGQKHANVG